MTFCCLLFVITQWSDDGLRLNFKKVFVNIILILDVIIFLVGIFQYSITTFNSCIKTSHKILEFLCFLIDVFIIYKTHIFLKAEQENKRLENKENCNIRRNDCNNFDAIKNNNVLTNDKLDFNNNNRISSDFNDDPNLIDLIYNNYLDNLIFMAKHYLIIFYSITFSYGYEFFLDVAFSGTKKTEEKIEENHSENDEKEISCYFYGSYDGETQFQTKQFFICFLHFLVLKLLPHFSVLYFIRYKTWKLLVSRGSSLLCIT